MLFDTYPHTLSAFCETMRRHGRAVSPDEAYKKMKITLWDAFRFYGVDDAFIKEFYAVENDLDFQPEGRPFDGVPALLRSVFDRGGRHFLYTHRDKVAYTYLARYGLAGLFSGGVTAEDGFPHKPAPDALAHILSTYGLKKEETLMLGDRLIDIGAGKNAGVRACLFDPDGNFTARDADFYCRDVPALAALIKNFEIL